MTLEQVKSGQRTPDVLLMQLATVIEAGDIKKPRKQHEDLFRRHGVSNEMRDPLVQLSGAVRPQAAGHLPPRVLVRLDVVLPQPAEDHRSSRQHL